jgi:hypothetical protein
VFTSVAHTDTRQSDVRELSKTLFSQLVLFFQGKSYMSRLFRPKRPSTAQRPVTAIWQAVAAFSATYRRRFSQDRSRRERPKRVSPTAAAYGVVFWAIFARKAVQKP